jgi:NADPH:quinone reductase-like Zn-dependent oxidoreductase
VVYDAIGSQEFAVAKNHLEPDGVYLTLVPVAGIDFFIPGQTEREAGKGYFVAWTPHASDLAIVSGWISNDGLRPVIDSEFPLEDIQAAHERSQTLRARGKIVIRVKE